MKVEVLHFLCSCSSVQLLIPRDCGIRRSQLNLCLSCNTGCRDHHGVQITDTHNRSPNPSLSPINLSSGTQHPVDPIVLLSGRVMVLTDPIGSEPTIPLQGIRRLHLKHDNQILPLHDYRRPLLYRMFLCVFMYSCIACIVGRPYSSRLTKLNANRFRIGIALHEE